MPGFNLGGDLEYNYILSKHPYSLYRDASCVIKYITSFHSFPTEQNLLSMDGLRSMLSLILSREQHHCLVSAGSRYLDKAWKGMKKEYNGHEEHLPQNSHVWILRYRDLVMDRSPESQTMYEVKRRKIKERKRGLLPCYFQPRHFPGCGPFVSGQFLSGS